MNHLYRVILILTIAAAMLFFPQAAQAQPLSTSLSLTSTYTNQQSAEDLFKRGVYEALIGNYKAAIENFTQVIHLRPEDAIAYTNQGLARAASGDRQGALKDFNQALRLNPELEVAYYNRGYVRFQLQDYQGALADFDRAIQLNPQDADAYQCRCKVRNQFGDMQGVVEDLKTAADLYREREKLDEYKDLLNFI
jgi:tetratricopeptide (TPR) repeat protein